MKSIIGPVIIGTSVLGASCVYVLFGQIYVGDHAADWAAVAVGLLGNILLVWTIRIGVEATKAATRAAEAAEKGLSIGQGPQISFAFGYTRNRLLDGSITTASIKIDFKNNGATPADECTYEYMLVRTKDGLASYEIKSYRVRGFNIAKDGEFTAHAGSLTEALLREIFAKNMQCFLMVRVSYENKFASKERQKQSQIYELAVQGPPDEWTQSKELPRVLSNRISDRKTGDKLISVWNASIEQTPWVQNSFEF